MDILTANAQLEMQAGKREEGRGVKDVVEGLHGQITAAEIWEVSLKWGSGLALKQTWQPHVLSKGRGGTGGESKQCKHGRWN